MSLWVCIVYACVRTCSTCVHAHVSNVAHIQFVHVQACVSVPAAQASRPALYAHSTIAALVRPPIV